MIKHSISDERGFSLLEILVALFLVALMFATFNYSSLSGTNRDKVEEVQELLERAVRFASDESVLRNTVIRIHFSLDKEPQEFTVEYGPDEDFILPKKVLNVSKVVTLKEAEELKKFNKGINKKFNKVKEFQEDPMLLPDNIKILAVGSSLTEYNQNDGEVSLYVFPSGEKDSAIISILSADEVATLETSSFTLDFERNYYPFSQTGVNPEDSLDYSNTLFEKWLKK